jgi:signal transduction histidine kinase
VERQPSTLKSVLFWNMVLIVLVTLGVVGSLLYASVVQTIRQSAEAEQALLAQQVTRTMEASLMGTVRLLQAFAWESGGDGDLDSRLRALLKSYSQITATYTLDKQGRTTAWFGRDATSHPAVCPPPLALAARYFQAGGLFYLSPWRAQEVDDPVILVAVPRLSQGTPSGMLVAEVSGPILTNLVIKLTEGGRIRISLVTEDGRPLGPGSPEEPLVLPAQVKETAGRAPTLEPVAAVVGNSLVTMLRAPWTGWTVVVQESTRDALTPILLAQWAFFVLTPLALMIATLLSFRQASLIAGEEARRIERLAVAVVEAQENERRRIAQDIHDWTAQRITSSFYHVQLLEKLLAKDPALVAKELPQLATTLDHANTELREIMRNLHPHLLNELGLAAAIKELVTDFARSAGLEHRVEVPEEGVPEPPKYISTALFRILQEALSNVEKHAAARRLEVVLDAGPGLATLTVADDGQGFDPDAAGDPARTERLGLSGMQERAELLGGDFCLTASPGQGTKVEVSIGWNPATTCPSES